MPLVKLTYLDHRMVVKGQSPKELPVTPPSPVLPPASEEPLQATDPAVNAGVATVGAATNKKSRKKGGPK